MKLKEFIDAMGTTPMSKLPNGGKKILVSKVRLPLNTIIHFVPSSEITVGMNSDHFLLKNVVGNIQIYHVEDMRPIVGTPVKLRSSFALVIKAYQRTHMLFKRVTNLDRAISNNTNPIIINYGLVPKMYKYQNAPINRYYEWVNGRNAIWDMLSQIGSRRTQFLHYQLPETLPSKSELHRCMEKFTVSSMDIIYEPLAWGVLELWRIIHFKNEYTSSISEEVYDKTFILFNEATVCVFINLGELLTYAEEKPELVGDLFYRFLTSIMSIRTPTQLDDVESEVVNDQPIGDFQNNAIIKKIKELGDTGTIGSGEQRYLTNLVNKSKNALDPAGTGVTLDKIEVTKEDIAIPDAPLMKDSVTVHDKSMLHSTTQAFNPAYVEKVLHKNVVQALLGFQNAGIIVKGIKITTKKTVATKSITYNTALQPINGPATTWACTIPEVESDGTFMVSGTRYRMSTQRGDRPIVKTKSDTVALTSYYGKVFVTRNNSTVNNFTKWFLREINTNSLEDGSVSDVVYGLNKVTSLTVPRHYSAIYESISSFKITIKSGEHVGKILHLLFLPNKTKENYTTDELQILEVNGLTPCGKVLNTSRVLGMDNNGIIYDVDDSLITPLGSIPFLINEKLGDGPVEYNEMSIMNCRVPLVFVFTYMFGLDQTLAKLKIPYYTTSPTAKIGYKANQYLLKFSDAQYVIDLADRKHATIMGGFNSIRKDIGRFRASNFSKQVSYTTILSSLDIMGYHLREIKLLTDMFIDPVTRDILGMMGYEGVDFYDLLLTANVMLLDDNVPKTISARYKGYERFAGFIYGQMINSLRQYRSKGNTPSTGVSVNPRAVMMDILQDETIAIVEDSNPIHSIKEMELFTYSGKGGRASVTMTKETRGYEANDMGTVSELAPDSSNVGVNAYFAPNAKLLNLYGMTQLGDPDTDGVSSFVSSSALLAPSADRDDSKRIAFTGIQMSHGVGCVNYSTLPYRTGYEDVIANRVGKKFAVTAKQDGVVVSVKPNRMVVKYADDKDDYIQLGVIHGIVAGETIPHSVITDLLPGDRFSAMDVLAFNPGFFERSILNPAAVSFKAGVLARIAIIETAGVIEDGSVLSARLAKLMQTRVCQIYPVMVPFNSLVHNLVSIGDDIEPDMILCNIDSDGETDIDPDAKDIESIRNLNLLAANSPKAKSYGKVTNFEVMYYGDLEDMNDSLRALVTFYDNLRAKQVKSLNLNEPTTGQVDESIRVGKNKLIENHVAIKIYVDNDLEMGAGDKLTIANMLKSTGTRVATEEMITEDGKPVDGLFSEVALAARIVESPLTGIINTALIELSNEMYRLYKEG